MQFPAAARAKASKLEIFLSVFVFNQFGSSPPPTPPPSPPLQTRHGGRPEPALLPPGHHRQAGLSGGVQEDQATQLSAAEGVRGRVSQGKEGARAVTLVMRHCVCGTEVVVIGCLCCWCCC